MHGCVPLLLKLLTHAADLTLGMSFSWPIGSFLICPLCLLLTVGMLTGSSPCSVKPFFARSVYHDPGFAGLCVFLLHFTQKGVVMTGLCAKYKDVWRYRVYLEM